MAHDFYLRKILEKMTPESFVGSKNQMQDEIFRCFYKKLVSKSNTFYDFYCIDRDIEYISQGRYFASSRGFHFDDFDLYEGHDLDDYGIKVRYELAKGLRFFEEEAVKEYRKFMIENLDKIENGLAIRYQQDLISHLRQSADKKLTNLQNEIDKTEKKLKTDIEFITSLNTSSTPPKTIKKTPKI